MIYVDELKDMKLYKHKFLLPRNGINRKKNNIVMLLTPNLASSISLINNPMIDTRNYQSYYLEKDVSFYVNNESGLERLSNVEYVHETEENKEEMILNEGVFSQYKPKIIYNGYKNDVDRVKQYVNTNTIKELNQNTLDIKIQYPISVTVYRNEVKIPTTAKSINIINRDNSWTNDKDYEYYCKEEIATLIVKTINPKVGENILEPVTMVLAGTYDEYNNLFNYDSIPYRHICEGVKRILAEPNGDKKLIKIIKDNDIKKLINPKMEDDITTAVKYIKTITEADTSTMDPVKRLKRYITYKSRRGSKHIINKVKNNIEDTVDPSVPNPEFKEKNNIDNKIEDESPDVPIIDADHPAVADINIGTGSTKSEMYISKLDGEYELTENYLRTENGITYFNEASPSYDNKLKKLLYRERIRKNKDVINLYDSLKEACPSIKFTYLSLARYKQRNLFVDLRYYNELFFRNNTYKLDKGIDLYFHLLDRMINDTRLNAAGYDKKRLVLVPVNDWDTNPSTKMWLYTADINPISMIYRLMIKNPIKLKETFGDVDFVFVSDNSYFKLNFSRYDKKDNARFLVLLKKLRNNEIVEDDSTIPTDSKKAIINSILDDIEDNSGVKISNLTGSNKENKDSKNDLIKADRIRRGETSDNRKVAINNNTTESDEIKKQIVNTVKVAANSSDSIEDAMDKLEDDDYFKQLLSALDDTDEGNSNAPQINASRKSRMEELDRKVLQKSINGKSIKEILNDRAEYNNSKLEKMDIPVDSINPEWHELTFPSAANMYDPNEDIVAMLYSLNRKTYPISIRDIEILDNSTSEDYILTYKVEMENHEGKRFTIKFDVPKIKENKYMVLRGNKKVISAQSFLMPVLKTDNDTVQIISNYNKIFIRRFGTNTGKSISLCGRIMKVLNKNTYPNIKITKGNNSKVCEKYVLPIDYIDFSEVYSKIETTSEIIYFNQNEIREKYKDNIDLKNGIPVGYSKNNKSIMYYNTSSSTFSQFLFSVLTTSDKNIGNDIDKTPRAVKYTYSKASILSSEIPLIVIAAFNEGLINVLNKSDIRYELIEKKSNSKFTGVNNSVYYDYIKFKDGFLKYDDNYESSLLLNGLKDCPTEMYSIGDINSRGMYMEFLDNFGGRIKADGIDNFYDCMIDPITYDVLNKYNLPQDYVTLLIYANNLLADNMYYKHGDTSVRRLRRNEIIAGYAYKALSSAYGSYATSIRRGREVPMTIKQSAIIDLILLDPTSADSSNINPLAEMESYNTVSTKGLSGMNSDRSYSLDKRAYDSSMTNVLSMSTSFAGNVGINRQATINASIDTIRGYIKQSSEDEMNSINSLCFTEALNPMGSTRDDPFRSAMTFIQTSKHSIRTKYSDPCLITNGASQALPYMISNDFAFKAKNKGKVSEFKEDDYMIITYADGTSDYVDLSSRIEKNSAAGFYQIIKLDTDLKKDSTVKKGSIIAYDKLAFNPSVGINTNLDYNMGPLVKCAMLDTDEGFEDSAIISNDLSEALSSEVVVKKELNLNKNTNVYNILPPGTPVEEGETLMTIQSSFDEDDANVLLKTLVDDPEEISNLGRVQIKSKVTGFVQDIEIYRTVEMEELSDSLQKLCKKYEKNIKEKKSMMNKYKIDQLEELKSDYVLDSTGKLKGAADGVQIIFYLKYIDKMSVGDKLIYWSANKGVVQGIFPKGKEPYCLSDPDEKLHTLVSVAAINGRMVASIQNVGVAQHLLVEAVKKAKDMAGISYDYNSLIPDKSK